MLHVFDGDAVALENVGKGLGTDGDRALHEFGDVVALEELAVEVGVGLGKTSEPSSAG